MATNIVPGPNSRVSLRASNFVEMGLNADNTVIVYQAEGVYKSWKPGRAINTITATETGKGYILISKANIDLTTYFAPPISASISFKYVLPTNGVLNI